MKRIASYITIILTMFLLSGCLDELRQDEFGFGKGESEMSLVLDFKPMSTGLEQTKSAGNALADISSLYVLVYDFNTRELKKGLKINVFTESEVERSDGEAENGHSAETKTKRATFTLPERLAYGKYYIYAVANIDNLLTDYASDIETVEGLKNLPLTWNATDITKNGQMLGHFTANGISSSDEAVIVNKNNMTLHAWLRRAASKVTVTFDGSGLCEGVQIYIKSVQLKDIPTQCYLGKDNTVGASGYTLNNSLTDGETLYLHEADPVDKLFFGDECSSHRVSTGAPYLGSHDEFSESLYFFENMQGAGQSMPDKRQDADGNHKLDHPGLPGDPEYRLKDDVPYGTYVEVKAHYVSLDSKKLGYGPITYRFMLGQNEVNDYNSKRNCHYKLTLKFKNYANDVDWHIEYEEPEPGVIMPEPYFISYLYNHSCMYPIKINTGGHKIKSVKAEIIDNPWAPYDAPGSVYWGQTAVSNGTLYPWNGFLSLRKTTSIIVGDDAAAYPNLNKDYYENTRRGYREYTDFSLADGEYSKDFTSEGDVEGDIYKVSRDEDNPYVYNVAIPLYTRAKQLYSRTGYTGNNPYVAHRRHAKVRVTVELEGVEPFVNTITVKQVRRIVNPKGVYRSSGNDKTFHMQLKVLEGEESENFVPVESEGQWKAYVIENHNGSGITLSGKEGTSLVIPDSPYTDVNGNTRYGDVVFGKTGSHIDFDINFSSGDYTGNRYAVIRVEYHNYSCYHLIFVRQGNAPDNLITGGAKWCAENMRSKTAPASSPLDEGSLFKFGNWDTPIDALSNNYKATKDPWINVTKDDFKAAGSLKVAGTNTTTTWNKITYSPKTGSFGDPDVSGKNLRVATYDDFWALRKSPEVELGYGVMYGDDADSCAVHINNAYGYDYENNTIGRGIRGCFVYNKTTGKSLFFPIGASGYGHRKQKYSASWGHPEQLNGVLRYSCGRTDYYPAPGVDNVPLFYDIFKRPGAVYWLNSDKSSKLGWDINYFTFDFNDIGSGDIFHNEGSDACFIRCVEK